MLGYRTDELMSLPVRNLYETEEDYREAGDHISSNLKSDGQSRMRARLRKKDGSLMDCEVQMASLNTKNPLYSRMVTFTDITKQLAISREMEHLSAIPHLELNPVIEVNEKGQIAYFNEASIDIIIRYGNGKGLEAFFPPDLADILTRIPKADTHCISRTIQVGPVSMIEHITLSGKYNIAWISVFDINDAQCIQDFLNGRNT
jgi:PAS domain S-box-containing protein